MKINMDYIARVEGESAVKIEIEDGKLKDLKLNIWEPPRFFEGFLVGRRFDEVPDIVARICGICPVSHMTTAIRAIENAIGFEPTPRIKKIRDIMALSQIMASHLAHLYVLALPDYFKLNSVVEMLPKFKELESVKKDAFETLKMIRELDYPDFKNDTEYVAVTNKKDYAINEGVITSSHGIKADANDYPLIFEESEISYSNAKRTVIKGRGSLMTGAIARLNLSFDLLHSDAKSVVKEIGFEPLEKNPFFNIIAQGAEIVHGIRKIIEHLEGFSEEESFVGIKVKEGFGSAVTEAPRGMLYHQYEMNKRGIIEKANIVTPTAHNFLSLEEGLKKLVNENIDKPKEEIILLCEMLVRAYDPCFSCSVH
ncbi:MAG: nickel-dependent hydrogenase large subunit [Nitrospirae bacterium]|nr:nickel-dependent hydrogenase large subunit [Nitrospirota bacterium]